MSPSSLPKLLGVRANSLNSQVTRVYDLVTNKTITVEALDVEISLILASYGQWCHLWTKVEDDSSLTTGDLDACHQVITAFEASYHDKVVKLHLHRAQMKQSPPPNNIAPARLELAKVKLEPFKGDVGEWEAWWTCFKSMVDDQPDTVIPLTAKYQLLVTSLEGDPKRLARSHPATLAGYQAALSSLKEHYADPTMQQSRVIDCLLNLRFVGQGPAAVMEFKTKVESLIQSWASLKLDISHPVIARIVLSKLPRNYRQRIFELSTVTSPSYEQIKQALKVIWDRQDFPDKPDDYKSEGARPKDKTNNSTVKTPSTPGSNTKQEKGEKKEKVKRCGFCKDPSHTTTKCTKFPDLKSRQQKVKELGLCIKCVRNAHEGDCKPFGCYLCDQPHHTWYHL